MANRHRGEVNAILDGRTFTLCLTLGALAELEDAFSAQHLGALTTRFGEGTFSAPDLVKVLGAGLRGGGHDVTDEAVAAMQAEGGASGFVAIVADLLTATFGKAE